MSDWFAIWSFHANFYGDYNHHINSIKKINRRDGVEVERSLRMRGIGVQSPVATDLSCKIR